MLRAQSSNSVVHVLIVCEHTGTGMSLNVAAKCHSEFPPRISTAVIKNTMVKLTWGGKDLFQHTTLRSHSITEVSQGRRPKQDPGDRN